MVDLHICNPVLIASTKPWTVFNFLLVGDALAKESVEDSANIGIDRLCSRCQLDYCLGIGLGLPGLLTSHFFYLFSVDRVNTNLYNVRKV
jgi:hypothetical protein